MCIRDRLARVGAEVHMRAVPPKEERFVVLDGLIDEPERSICLLYTSDAADDLLCVDLGGSRIIKKKNNT